jgi:hypothetical protein
MVASGGAGDPSRPVPLARPNQYAAMLDAAGVGGFAYPAVNVVSSQTLNAELDGFAAAGSDASTRRDQGLSRARPIRSEETL